MNAMQFCFRYHGKNGKVIYKFETPADETPAAGKGHTGGSPGMSESEPKTLAGGNVAISAISDGYSRSLSNNHHSTSGQTGTPVGALL